MKKAILLFLLLLLSFSTIFADSSSYSKVSSLLDDGLYGNEELIRAESFSLSYEEKEEIYNSNRKSFVVPMLLNLVPGFGVGSFSQGDKTTGWVSLAGEIVSIATIITPFIFHEALMGEWYWPLITGAGFCGLLAFKAYALYQNYNYAWDYNDDLYTLLFEGPELALVPFYNLEEETLGTTLIASINF